MFLSTVAEEMNRCRVCFPDYAHLKITIASRSLLEQVGGFWQETRCAEDVYLFERLCSVAEKIRFRPDVSSEHSAPVKHDKESASKIVGSLTGAFWRVRYTGTFWPPARRPKPSAMLAYHWVEILNSWSMNLRRNQLRQLCS